MYGIAFITVRYICQNLIVCFGYFIGYCKIKICPKPFQPKTGLVKLTSQSKGGNELDTYV
jgi:hypothetical protein